MSLLKQKLAKKLTLLLGYECFSAATFSARNDVTLKIADEPQPYGVFEIFADQQSTGDKL